MKHHLVKKKKKRKKKKKKKRPNPHNIELHHDLRLRTIGDIITEILKHKKAKMLASVVLGGGRSRIT